MTAALNSAPTGLPAISGTPQVEQTLTASTSNIDDEDGLANVAYSYQWIAVGTDIDGATGFTYTLTASEEGDSIQVRVEFEDDQGNQESLTSVATGTVAAKPVPLTASFSNLPDSHDGSAAFTFQVLFSEDVGISYANMRDDAFSVSDGDVDGARRVSGRGDLWEITVEPDGNSDVVITLPANRSCTTAGAVCTREDSPRELTNSPWAIVHGPSEDTSSDATEDNTEDETEDTTEETTEETTVTSQLVVVSATASEEDDATIDFVVTLSPASGKRVSADYATADGTAASGRDYTAATGSITFAAGETSKTVTVAIIDDSVEEEDETLTLTLSNPSGAEIHVDQATGTITDSEPVLLTTSFSGVPASHDGSSEFTFVLTFSEDVAAGYQRIRDDALSVSIGTTIERAQRVTQGSNIGWTITVKPTTTNPVTITLPETTDCDAVGAICTKDDSKRMLSHSTSITLPGPG